MNHTSILTTSWGVALWALSWGLGCQPDQAKPVGQAPGPGEPPPLGWEAVEAAEATSMRGVLLPARVVQIAEQRGQLASPLGGQLTRWLVKPGQSLTPGQAVAELRSQPLDELHAQLGHASRALTQQARVVELMDQQVSAGVLARAELSHAQLELVRAQSARDALAGQLATLRAQGVERAPGGLWRWRSPLGGQLGVTTCAQGAWISPGQVCAQLSDARAVQLQVMLPQRELPSLERLESALWTPSLPDARPQPVTLSWREQALDAQLDALALYFSWPEPEATDAAASSSVRQAPLNLAGLVELRWRAPAVAVRAPRSALTWIEGQPHVFILDQAGQPAPLAVELLRDEGDAIIARHASLAPGVKIVHRGVFWLKSQRLLSEE